MGHTYKVKLLTFPRIDSGTVGLAATIAPRGRDQPYVPPARFNTMSELRRACERANIPALVYGMPAPNIVYELTLEQLAALGFDLQGQLKGHKQPA